MIRAGAAEVVITPPVGTPLAGYFSPRISTAVHDDLFARALVLEDGDVALALVSLDLKSIKLATVEEARALIERGCGIPSGNILVCCSHTHTGPYPSRTFSHNPDPDFLRLLPRFIAESVIAAHGRMDQARIGVNTGCVEGIAFNRRFRMADGSVRTNPGIGSTDIIEPAGPTDPALGVIKVLRADGRLLAVWVNFTVHTDVVTGNEISADYPGELSRSLKQRYGPEVIVLYANGACGDINHLNVQGPPVQSGFDHASWMGERLADETARVLERTETHARCRLGVARDRLDLPLRDISREEMNEARRRIAAAESRGAASRTSGGDPSISTETIFARGVLEVAAERETEPTAPAEIQVIRIGDAAIVTNPAELFVEPGLEIKRQSPFTPTFVVGYANGMVGYVPTAKAFGEGGYETRLCRSSKLMPETADRIVDASVRLLNAALSEKTPKESA